MPESPEFLVDRLAVEGEKTREFYSSLSPEQWATQVYEAGQAWDIRQLLAHFVATERGIRRLIEDVLAGGQGVHEGFNIDEYNEEAVTELSDQTVDTLLRDFQDARAKTTELVRQMIPADLDKTGRHPFLGMTSIAEMVKLLYRHNQLHQRDVKRLITL